MQIQNAPVQAAIDIGSNTVHLVVARCVPDDLAILVDEEEVLRIGESVNATGAISEQKCNATIRTLSHYKALAQQHSAEQILVVATEAIRKATNSEEFLACIKENTGLEVQIIDGDVEAALTFYGATYELGHEKNPPARLAVMDLGGGSMELVVAQDMQMRWHTSLPIGSGWLHDRYLPSDPPTLDELDVARTFLQSYFQGLRIKPRPPVLVATGGSANSLLFLARKAFSLLQYPQTDRRTDEQLASLPRAGRRGTFYQHLPNRSSDVAPGESATYLSRDDLVRCEGLLCALPADEVSRRFEQSVKRTRILPAGLLIVRALVDRLRLDGIRVSPHGIREGALLAYARYGDAWLEQVKQNAGQANRRKKVAPVSPSIAAYDVGASGTREEKAREPFASSGRRLLQERVGKMLDWYDEVLKHDDIEAVHKMRVASRRLRAVLDAYESACDPRQFKKVYRRIKDIADMLGKARDTDVMIENLRVQVESLPIEEQPGVQWLIDRLRAYRQEHQQKLDSFLSKLDTAALKQQGEACLPVGGYQHGES